VRRRHGGSLEAALDRLQEAAALVDAAGQDRTPERLAAAFRRVLERLADEEPIPVGALTFSVAEKADELRARLRAGVLQFEEIFAAVRSRLEAVACFLALLELLRLGEATVEQLEAFGPITVRGGG